jgi:hypothetical protein
MQREPDAIQRVTARAVAKELETRYQEQSYNDIRFTSGSYILHRKSSQT